MDIFNGLSSFPSRIYSHKTNRNIKRIGIKHKKRNEPFEIRRRKQWGFIKPFLSVVTGRTQVGICLSKLNVGNHLVFGQSKILLDNAGVRAGCKTNVISWVVCYRQFRRYCTVMDGPLTQPWSITPSTPSLADLSLF